MEKMSLELQENSQSAEKSNAIEKINTDIDQNTAEKTNEIHKETVDFVFNEKPEFASVGTKEQYLEYIKKIFPESTVQDVLWHGTQSKEFFEQFDINKNSTEYRDFRHGAIYFTNSRADAEHGGVGKGDKINSLMPVRVNVQKIATFEQRDGNQVEEELKGSNNLGIKLEVLKKILEDKEMRNDDVEDLALALERIMYSKVIENKVLPSDFKEKLEDIGISPLLLQYYEKERHLFGDYKYEDLEHADLKSFFRSYIKDELFIKDNKVFVRRTPNIIGITYNNDFVKVFDNPYPYHYSTSLDSRIIKFSDTTAFELKKMGIDAVKTKKENNRPEWYLIFDPDQIHILGSKKDLAEFKVFIQKQN